MQREITARRRHYPQQDTPDEAGQALATEMHTLDETKRKYTA
jgi:hypothetical protein